MTLGSQADKRRVFNMRFLHFHSKTLNGGRGVGLKLEWDEHNGIFIIPLFFFPKMTIFVVYSIPKTGIIPQFEFFLQNLLNHKRRNTLSTLG